MRYALPDRGPATITRTMDATFLNTVANHPDVRPWLGGDGPLDLTAMLANPANLAGVTAHGGFVAVAVWPGRYEVHSLFLPDGRGTESVRAMRAACDYIFTVSDATELVTKVPSANTAADGLARLAHFAPLATVPMPWTGGTRTLVGLLSLSIDRWALHSAAAWTLGGWLHQTFEAVKAATGSTLPAHAEDDETHHYMAGAALLLIRAGQTVKGVDLYNRWALLAGYPGIRVVREHPPILDLDGMIAEAREDTMEILQCQ